MAVYEDRARAEHARDVLFDAGIGPQGVALDEPLARVASLKGEQHQEFAEAWVIPNAGVVYPKEAARGLVAYSALGALVGGVLGVGLAFLDFGYSLAAQLVVMCSIGITFGLAVGMVIGPAVASRRPAEQPPAVTGSVLMVKPDDPKARAALIRTSPVRIDSFTADGIPLETIDVDEPGDDASGPVGEIAGTMGESIANLEQGDDYTPPPNRR